MRAKAGSASGRRGDFCRASPIPRGGRGGRHGPAHRRFFVSPQPRKRPGTFTMEGAIVREFPRLGMCLHILCLGKSGPSGGTLFRFGEQETEPFSPHSDGRVARLGMDETGSLFRADPERTRLSCASARAKGARDPAFEGFGLVRLHPAEGGSLRSGSKPFRLSFRRASEARRHSDPRPEAKAAGPRKGRDGGVEGLLRAFPQRPTDPSRRLFGCVRPMGEYAVRASRRRRTAGHRGGRKRGDRQANHAFTASF